MPKNINSIVIVAMNTVITYSSVYNQKIIVILSRIACTSILGVNLYVTIKRYPILLSTNQLMFKYKNMLIELQLLSFVFFGRIIDLSCIYHNCDIKLCKCFQYQCQR